jgi:hypothetical protein
MGTQRDPCEPELRDIARNPVGECATHSWAVAFDDLDQDGDPDIWVADDVPGTIQLYRNDTSAGARADQVKFTLISKESGVDLIGAWMGFAFLDVNQDGVQDVFGTNAGPTTYMRPNPTKPNRQKIMADSGFNRWNQNAFLNGLFRNDGTRVIQVEGKDQVIGVFPNITQAVVVEPSSILPPRSLDPANIHPQKRSIFGLGAYEFGFGAVGFDYNNDTNDDLYWIGSLGRPGQPFGAILDNPGRLLMGTGPNTFKDVTVGAHALDILRVNYANVDASLPLAPEDRISTQFHEDGRAVISDDLNNDGFPDLVLTNAGGFDSTLPEVPTLFPEIPNRLPRMKVYTPGPIFIFINEGNDNNWLKVRLIGGMEAGDPVNSGKSNRDAVGTSLRATVRAPEGRKVLVRTKRMGESFMASTNSEVHFGLRQADVVDTLEVLWPGGRVDVFSNVSANQTITIKEGQGIVDREVASTKSKGAAPLTLMSLWLGLSMTSVCLVVWFFQRFRSTTP